jgi:starch synthase
MTYLTIYFEAHQPRRLRKTPTATMPFDAVLDREVLHKVAEKCYLPANALLSRLIRENEGFKVCLSVTGTLLDQAHRFMPELLGSFQELGDLAKSTGRVEFLAETYYHSLSGLYSDPGKTEFKAQVLKHSELMQELFGVTPTSMRNTELLYNNSVATAAAQMGFKAILCEKRADMMKGQSPNAVFEDKSRSIKVIPRNFGLSDDLAFRFTHRHMTADEFAGWIDEVDGEAVMIGMDYEAIGEHQWADSGIFDFLEHLPPALARQKNVVMKNPTELAESFHSCPPIDVDDLATSSWADEGRNTNAWLGNRAQQRLFEKHQSLENKVVSCQDNQIVDRWRHLGTSDNLYYMCTTRHGDDGGVHDYFSHFADPSEAIMVYSEVLRDLERRRLKKVQAKKQPSVKRNDAPRILLVTPEVTELPEGMGNLANVVRAKGGGLADISAALVGELLRLGLDVHVALPKYERQMREYAKISQREIDQIASSFRARGQKRIHLVRDSAFSHIQDVYEQFGDNTALSRAISFQRAVINHVLEDAMPSNGKMLVHCNDWMTGLIPAAAKARGIKSVFTFHNMHSGRKTMRDLENHGLDVGGFHKDLYLDAHPDHVPNAWETVPCDFLISGIKACDFVNTVSPSFLKEIVDGEFPDLVPPALREAVRAKYYSGWAKGILNAPKSTVNPAIARGLAMNYDDTNFVEAKRVNKLALQERMGLHADGDAPLMFWPHRLFSQKGPELLAQIAQVLVDRYATQGLQIAIVGNGEPDMEQQFGRISVGSHGRIAYSKFDPYLSELGKAASDFILMPSLYEPCGLPQMEGMRYGSLPIVRATGGLRDSVKPLDVVHDTGNGFVFEHFNADALWWACTQAMEYWSQSEEVRNRTVHRVMNEGVDRFNLERTTLAYVRIYEKLLGEPLL